MGLPAVATSSVIIPRPFSPSALESSGSRAAVQRSPRPWAPEVGTGTLAEAPWPFRRNIGGSPHESPTPVASWRRDPRLHAVRAQHRVPRASEHQITWRILLGAGSRDSWPTNPGRRRRHRRDRPGTGHRLGTGQRTAAGTARRERSPPFNRRSQGQEPYITSFRSAARRR